MKNKLIAGIIFLILIILLVIFVFLNSTKKQVPQFDDSTNNITQAPLISNLNPSGKYQILYTDPKNQANEVNLNQNIIIKFNRDIISTDISIITEPEFSYNQKVSKSILTLLPETDLIAGTDYLITFIDNNTNKYIGVLAFITKGQPSSMFSQKPDLPPDFGNQRDQDELEKYSDIYLTNKLPYISNSFSIISQFDGNLGKFIFNVKLLKTNKDESKTDFINWLYGIGFNDNQINTLVINYE